MQSVPLNKLQLSEINVRKTERDADIIGLAADIAERGLKQNLVVIPVPKKKGMFEVIAGGRRYLAMQYLVSTDRLAADFEVPILVDTPDQAVETSLAENIQRVAMNPADEFTAFQTIIDQSEGTTSERIENCARRFGTTATHVRGRLRLAGLADSILDALRSNTITLASAMAYASVDDQDKQTVVFEKQCKSNWKPHDPDDVRRAMKDRTYTASDPAIKYIGRDAYVERGGRIDVDMFLLDQPERMIDTKLADELVKEKFKADLPVLLQEHGFVDGRLVDQSWSTPKIEGYTSKWAHGSVLEDLHSSGVSMIGIFYLDGDGKPGRGQNVMIPAEPVEPREPEAPRDWEAERAAATRASGIRLEAFRRAIPLTEGTAFAQRIYLPTRHPRFQEDEKTGDVYLEVTFRVSADELQANYEAGEAAYNQLLADQEAAEAAKQAELQAAQEQQETIRGELLAGDPPAVVRLDTDPAVFFRREDGSYWEELAPEDPEDENFLENACSLEELIMDCTVLQHWATLEDYQQSMADAG